MYSNFCCLILIALIIQDFFSLSLSAVLINTFRSPMSPRPHTFNEVTKVSIFLLDTTLEL